MNARTGDESQLTFESLGRTLELLDGEPTRIVIAYTHADELRRLCAIAGVLHIVQQEELDAKLGEQGDPTPVPALPGERALLFKVAELSIAVSSAHFVNASYEDRKLGIVTGSALLELDFNEVNDVV